MVVSNHPARRGNLRRSASRDARSTTLSGTVGGGSAVCVGRSAVVVIRSPVIVRHDKRVWVTASCGTAISCLYRVMNGVNAPTVTVEGRECVMLGSNNYLGMADHPVVREGAERALKEYGTTVTGSRLLNGTIDLHVQLEDELAAWDGTTKKALTFTTGYQANLGAISALVGVGDTVIVDSAAHASIYDAARLSRAKIRAFRHNNAQQLDERLSRSVGAKLVVVDGLYSMEGDLAPLHEIADVCEKHDAALMVDEAHSVACLGERRTGAAEPSRSSRARRRSRSCRRCRQTRLGPDRR